MGERLQLVEMVRNQRVPVAEAARLLGVSRRTAHKWLNRAEEHGLEKGLADRSRARPDQARFSGPVAEALLALRHQHPRWGPKTLVAALKAKHPGWALPAASTAGELLRREGLVLPRKRSPRVAWSPYSVGEMTPTEPNDRWTIDYKGQFRLRNGTLCYPLTVRDAVSRAVLGIRAFNRPNGTDVLETLDELFEENGLPREVHSDTGSPFGTNAIARLSPVSVVLLKLGIRPVYSRPGNPQDNGAHERMHRDLKAETTRPPGRNLSDQQRRFDKFRAIYNEQRPHHGLDFVTPASLHRPSPRRPPAVIPSPSYPNHFEMRRVETGGFITWKSTRLHVATPLRRETVGLEPIADGLWRVFFTDLAIALLSERGGAPRLIAVSAEEETVAA